MLENWRSRKSGVFFLARLLPQGYGFAARSIFGPVPFSDVSRERKPNTCTKTDRESFIFNERIESSLEFKTPMVKCFFERNPARPPPARI